MLQVDIAAARMQSHPSPNNQAVLRQLLEHLCTGVRALSVHVGTMQAVSVLDSDRRDAFADERMRAHVLVHACMHTRK